MHYWDTGDRVTDKNLASLERWTLDDVHMNSDQASNFASAMIDMTEMLPRLVKRHFSLPHLFIGDLNSRWTDEQRSAWISGVCQAISSGIEKAASDEALKRENSPDFRDRPKSRGEVVLEALEKFSKSRSRSDLGSLSIAVSSTNLQSEYRDIEKAYERKRPAPNTTLEGEIFRAISALEFHAERWFSMKAPI
jgi:hypothetical protein